MLINSYRFGGATPWTPALITTALWLDANDSATVIQGGGAVTTWNNKSGNSNNFTIAGNPQYQTTGLSTSKPAVAFDGTGDFMSGAIAGLSTFAGFDFYAVFQSTLAAAADTSSFTIYGAGDLQTTSFMGLLGSTGLIAGETIPFAFHNATLGTGGRLGSTTYSRAANTAQILNSRQSSSGYSLLANGTSVSLSLANIITTSTNTAPSNASLPGNTLHIAAFVNSGAVSSSPAMKVSEVVITSSLLPTLDRQRLEGYLAHKWGLTANLPAGHPYKSAAPTV